MRSSGRSARALGRIRRLPLGIVAAGLVAVSGCSSLRVHSLPAPGTDIGRRYSFRIIERPAATDSARSALATRTTVFARTSPEVMLNNSIMDELIRDDIQAAFQTRGYVVNTANPDFEVAYYAQAVERIEIDDDRGYRYGYYGYGHCCYIDEFTEGTIVIDVLDASTGRLIWRGSGEARVSDRPEKYAKQINKAIEKIVERFPQAGMSAALFEGGDQPELGGR